MSKKWEFPKIYRTITERLNSTKIGLILFILIIAIVISGLDLYKNLQNKQKIDQERQEIISEIKFWQGVASKYQGYRDAYYQLAVLEYRLKDFDKAKFYLKKVLVLDPNFEEGRRLHRFLSF